jgi:inosine-uridine nucleoside N-ribohydrolase
VIDVILDCDPGHDDAIALLLALASPEVKLLGVTTVAGNQTLEKTTANAIRVLDHVGRTDIPVAAGASRPLVRGLGVAAEVDDESGLDGLELPPPSRRPDRAHAIDWIAETLRAPHGRPTLVATGPLTNVALFLARYPELAGRLERIVMMGGAAGQGNVTPAAEFNMWVDPEAARRVFDSGLDLTMVGLDVTHRALMRSIHAERLSRSGTAGRLVAELISFYVRSHRQRDEREGASIHDAVAMAHVIDGTLLATAHCGVIVDTGPEPSRGRTHVDLYGRAGWEPNCHVAVDIESERFLELLIGRLSA